MEVSRGEIAVCATTAGFRNAINPAIPRAVPSGIRGRFKTLAVMAQLRAEDRPFLWVHQAMPVTRPKAARRTIAFGTTIRAADSGSVLHISVAMATKATRASVPKTERTHRASWAIYKEASENPASSVIRCFTE